MSTTSTALAGTAASVPPVLSAGQAALAPFVPPRLVRTGAARAFALLTRVAMLVWAYTVGVIGVRWDGDRDGVHRVITTMTLAAAAIGVAWAVAAVWWSVLRTRNVHRLEGRFPPLGRAVRVWTYPPAWVAMMSLTLVRVAPHPDFDVRPMIIVVGFLVAMVAPYRLVQRIFRSLVRVQPDAAVFVLYIVDTIAFGVIWWRLAVWPSEAARVDRATVDLLAGSVFAAGVALLIGLWLTVYLDRETDRSEDTRVLALRTRHDHRLARLQGLDPMDRATRWALWLARKTADQRVVVAEPIDPLLVPPTRVTVSAPPLPRPIEVVAEPVVAEPVVVEPVVVEPVVVEPVAELDVAPAPPEPEVEGATEDLIEPDPEGSAPASTAALLRERVLRAIGVPEVEVGGEDEAAAPPLPTLPERTAPDVSDVAAALVSTGAGPAPAVDDAAVESDSAEARLRSLQQRIGAPTAGTTGGTADIVARALQRRLAESQRVAERTARRPSLAGRLTPTDDTATVSTVAERLAARLGADLERGGGSEFASRVRELSEQYHREPSARNALPSADLGEPDGATPSRGLVPPRLMLVESCRFLALVLLAVAAAGMVWVLVLSAGQGNRDASTLDDIELARSVALHALGLSHVFVLAWLSAAAEVSKRVESSVRWWPYVGLAAVSAPCVTGAIVLDFGAAERWSVVALAIATVACAAGLRLIAFPNEMLGRPAGALNAWMVGVVALLGVLVASPLTSPIDDAVARDSLAFGAIVAGLALMVVTALGGVVMSQYENVLRASTELAVARESGARRRERERSAPQR